MDNNQKILVIGAGMAGVTVARKLAEEGNRKVIVLEKRNHVAGNCYDENDEYGILIHKYGPHIFHTNIERVFKYLSRFTDWDLYHHKVVAKVGDKLIPVPFNINTLKMVYGEDEGEQLKEKLVREYGYGSKVPIMKLRENEDPDIQKIAEYVYQNVFLKYTMKQWGQKPEEISPQVTGRVPVVISEDDSYFQDTYQGMPLKGYTSMVEKMLQHENIEVRLNASREAFVEMKDGKIYFEGKEWKGEVIYTGPIDELFDSEYGHLPYRTLDFAFEHFDKNDYQGHSVVNYTVSEDYTRITEFKHLTRQKDGEGTTIVKEYPRAYESDKCDIPYYSIQNEENQLLYDKYLKRAEEYANLHLLGRLAEYKYYNIDAIVDKAITMADEILNK